MRQTLADHGLERLVALCRNLLHTRGDHGTIKREPGTLIYADRIIWLCEGSMGLDIDSRCDGAVLSVCGDRVMRFAVGNWGRLQEHVESLLILDRIAEASA